MAAHAQSQQHPYDEGMYSSDNLKNVTLDDGTRVVTSPQTNIKRPVCAGIDVHKSILMAAVCVTDKETLKAVFYVRQFTSANSDIRRMAEWLTGYGVRDVCMESTGKYWIPVYDILEQNGLHPTLTHPKYVNKPKVIKRISAMPSISPTFSGWIWSSHPLSRLQTFGIFGNYVATA